MSSTPPLPNSARDLRLLKALEAEREQRRARNRLAAYRPYIKQREFHDAGATHRERLFLAGNQLGKTLAGSFEVAMHLTGLYPEWWKGRRWDRPIVAWAAGVTGESTRDNPQRLLLGRSGQFGTGAVPAAATIATTRAAGIADLVDTARIAHISGGESLLAFKSYEKGREKWQGETLDLVWFDEEPPRDIYSEGLTRTNATGGCVFLTCTPLLGMTEVIGRFLQAPTPDRHVTQMTIDDADHYTAEERARIVAGYAPHEREARAKGIPMLGSGRIFPLPEDSIACDAIPLAAHWPRIGGMDFGWDHPFAAVELAHDRDTDTVYVTKAYRVREATPLVHAAALKPWGAWLPWAWPADGLQHSKDSGKPLAEQYRAQGLNLLPYHARYPDNPDSTPGTSGVEAGLIDMLDRMQSSRLKVFRCPAGKLTIGIGRNLDDVGLTRGEAFMLASNDIVRTEALLEKLAVWGALGDVRQRVLCDMAFNMGVAGLMQFRKMFAAIEAQDFARAADEMLASAWAKQVPGRADKLARMMRTGHDVS